MSNAAIEVQLRELKDLTAQLNTTVKQQSCTISAMTDLLASKDQRIAELTEELRSLRKALFGSSSERMQFENVDMNSDQLNLLKELGLEPEPPAEIVEAEVIDVPAHQRKKKPTLEEQFENIETRVVHVDPLSDEERKCPVCGTELVPIGTEVIRREVVHVRPKLYMIEYVGTTYKCPDCTDNEEPVFIKESAPPAIIEGSYASESLLTWTFYQKFALAVPFYRLEKDFEDLGAKISRTSMANWSIQCSKLYFSHMTEYFHRKLLERKFLMMDETPIQVLNEPGKRAQSKSYVWLLRSGNDGLPPIIYYRYSPTRSGDTAVEMTDGISPGTYLMCDGYTGYNKLKDIRRCTCFAHIRRYLQEAIPKGHENDLTEPAVQGVMYCNKLFDFERRYDEQHLKPETRMTRRLKHEKPVVEAFIKWADAQVVTGNGKFAKAITYIRNRREYMMTYLEDGRCSLSNNWSENSVRPVTVGRKNWLFSTSVDGAEASMNIYTIVEMARLYGLSRYKYIEFLLKHRPNGNMSDDELDKLAPWDPDVQKACSKSYFKDSE